MAIVVSSYVAGRSATSTFSNMKVVRLLPLKNGPAPKFSQITQLVTGILSDTSSTTQAKLWKLLSGNMKKHLFQFQFQFQPLLSFQFPPCCTGRDLSPSPTPPLHPNPPPSPPASDGDSPPSPYGSTLPPSPTPPPPPPHGRCADPIPFLRWGNRRLLPSGTGGIGDGDGSSPGNLCSPEIWNSTETLTQVKPAGSMSSPRSDPRSGSLSDLIKSDSRRPSGTTPAVTAGISTTTAPNSEVEAEIVPRYITVSDSFN
ncbi:hypothetical protein L1987_58404 [Smallanthus sonchifolius]|uniref:Uncharacterized protein n=1 Tax=Smallanthus sonchifolius TaxID=185202 RepID=A0ACB9DG10_9ASTR|nr:hypothetical protein L1987_58404 [Smallanthus sonchifolius]